MKFISSHSYAVGFAAFFFFLFGFSARGEVPTMALRAVGVNGSPIEATSLVSVSAGDTVEVEIHIWGWGTEIPAGIDQVSASVLNRRGSVSGSNGTVLPLGWEAPLDNVLCNPSEGGPCSGGFICVGSGSLGLCQGAAHFPGFGAVIDTNRQDYVFFGFNTIRGTGTSQLDYTYFGLTTEGELRVDDGGTWYVGTVVLVVSEAACGPFTFFLSRCSGLTLLGSRDVGEIEPQLVPLEIDTGVCPLLPTATFPSNCDIDARGATALDGSNDPLGWGRVSFHFDRNPAGTSVSDFSILVVPETVVPQIVQLAQVGSATLILTLDGPISPERWTCIKHLPSTRTACFGSLPVDVDQSLNSGPPDVAALLANLDGDEALQDFRCDLDRSLRCRPQDVLEAIDLLNGAVFSPWGDAAIVAPCPSDSSAIFRDPRPEDLGACCNPNSGGCTDSVSFEECSAVFGGWSSATPCCAAACHASAGSCCHESTGSCVDNVFSVDCRGSGEIWAANLSCDAVECGLPRGACCNSAISRCWDDALDSQCQLPGENWLEGSTCGQILCGPS